MKKLVKNMMGIIVGFVLIALVIISTVGENKVDYSKMNVVDVELSGDYDMYIPIEDWTEDEDGYTWVSDNNYHIIYIGKYFVPEGTEVIHIVSND